MANNANARNALTVGTNRARGDVSGGFSRARGAATRSYDRARGDVTGRYGQARGAVQTGFGRALAAGRAGYGDAKAVYQTPEAETMRDQLLARIRGEGGFDPQTVNAMKANVRENYGTAARGLLQNLDTFRLDSVAPGLEAENMARGLAQLAATRGQQTRDIDISSAELARREAMEAMPLLQRDLSERAGLSAEEAQFLANLEASQGTTLGQLFGQEGNMLGDLSARQGDLLANLYGQEGTALGQLSAHEGTGLANLFQQQGQSLSGLSVDEAQWLSNLYMQQAGHQAQSRNTAGMMPLIGGGMQMLPAIVAAGGSSVAFKTNIRPLAQPEIDQALREVMKLNLYEFSYHGERRRRRGVIIEDPTTPGAIIEGQGINVYDLAATLAMAVKALTRRVEELEAAK